MGRVGAVRRRLLSEGVVRRGLLSQRRALRGLRRRGWGRNQVIVLALRDGRAWRFGSPRGARGGGHPGLVGRFGAAGGACPA
jgi:hypothetical protein